MTRPPGRWLQRELRRRLMLPVLGIVVISGLLSTYSAHALLEEVFDRWLLDAARSLATQVRFVGGRATISLTAQSEALLTYDIVDRVSYEVRQGNVHVLGQSGLPTSGASERTYSGDARAFDGVYEGYPVRVGTVTVRPSPGEEAVVTVTETREKRKRAMWALALVLSPVGLLVLAAALAIASAVRRTVLPLERMAALWNERSHVSLQPVPTHDVPHELMPFADALNELLGRVQQLLDRERHFAATAAHQLRTPMAGLQLGLARALSCPDLISTRATIEELSVSTQRAARVVQQLLALSRLDANGPGSIELASIDLVGLARDVGEAFMDAAQEKSIELALEAESPHVRVTGQHELLSDALGNLLDNAIRYTPAGGSIALSVHSHPPSISVTDTGPGISHEEEDRVFERFVRGRGTFGDGSGLGLAIVKEIAELHSAAVVLDRAPDGRTRFTLVFPRP